MFKQQLLAQVHHRPNSDDIDLAPIGVHCVIPELKVRLHYPDLGAFKDLSFLQLQQAIGKAFPCLDAQ